MKIIFPNYTLLEIKFVKKRKKKKRFIFPIIISIFLFLLVILILWLNFYNIFEYIINKTKQNKALIIKNIDSHKKENIISQNRNKQVYNNYQFQQNYNNSNVQKKSHNNNTQKFYTPKTYGKIVEISFNYTKAIEEQMNKKVNTTILKSFPKNKLKFAMCSIGKLENLNVRDFIIYYLELGIDKIYIYDNNEIDGEKFEDVVQDFIDQNYVEIINIRGNQTDSPQKYAYETCYHDHINDYDWFLFFDFDEYLYIENYTLNDFVQLSLFSNCSSIIYFWRHATDNNQLYYNSESPMKRFPILFSEDTQKIYHPNQKSMSKGGIKELTYTRSCHAPFFVNDTYNTKYISCNTEGKMFDKFQKDHIKFQSYITFKNAYALGSCNQHIPADLLCPV